MQKTYYPKPGDVTREWIIVDAHQKNLGRLASRVARVLLGKDKPEYTPGVELGDFVIVTNARDITVTGRKLDQKIYYRHSGYPGGLKSISLREQLDRFPERDPCRCVGHAPAQPPRPQADDQAQDLSRC